MTNREQLPQDMQQHFPEDRLNEISKFVFVNLLQPLCSHSIRVRPVPSSVSKGGLTMQFEEYDATRSPGLSPWRSSAETRSETKE
jgi:hypothetical protein